MDPAGDYNALQVDNGNAMLRALNSCSSNQIGWDDVMTRAAFTFTLNPEFGPFLFAAIGSDPNGKVLTVLSAFARTSMDPWQEAANLARMPRQAATLRLAEFISSLPNKPNAQIPAKTVAGDLVALLPAATDLALKMPDKASDVFKSNSHLALTLLAIAIVNLLMFLALSNPAPKSEPAANPPASSDQNSTQMSPSYLAR